MDYSTIDLFKTRQVTLSMICKKSAISSVGSVTVKFLIFVSFTDESLIELGMNKMGVAVLYVSG